MIVKFDLRPAELVKKEVKRKSLNVMGIIAAVLIVLFVASSGFYLVTMTMNLLSLRDDVFFLTGDVDNLELDKRALEVEIGRLRVREKTFADTLKIMQDEMPSIEVLGAIEKNISYGMGVTRLQFSQAPTAPTVMNATAATTDQIVEFTDGLKSSGVFSDSESGIRMLTSTYSELTKRVSFTLNLTVNPIGKIGQDSSAQR
ncbi:hypothetical protein AGMMS50276_17710 [Synergistales bacterium]|nr:hypothetical protein AGMMS50276_17710 [Synergistales bacterium]